MINKPKNPNPDYTVPESVDITKMPKCVWEACANRANGDSGVQCVECEELSRRIIQRPIIAYQMIIASQILSIIRDYVVDNENTIEKGVDQNDNQD